MLKHLENSDGVFDPEAVRILTSAFNDAWKSIADSGMTFASNGHAEAMREILALRIIELARLGERDQNRLRDYALLHLAHHIQRVPNHDRS
jgi:hypothetical protein